MSLKVESSGHRCVLCGEQLPTKPLLQEHFRKHANKEITTSSSTQGQTVRKQSDSSKIKDAFSACGAVSNTQQPVKCDVCEQAFPNVTQAIQHKYKQHPNCQIKHHCEYCGKQFPLVVCKDIHIKSEHKNQKKPNQRFQCKECSAQFYSVPAVRFHVQGSHKRINTMIAPIQTMPPSKKIKMSNSGDQNSVYYCHLCGMEYIVKFNLQKHLQLNHSEQDRSSTPQDIVKCSLCEAMFYNKKAYDVHNMCHTPKDLYIESEEDRKQAVTRVDCDFDLSRVPTIFDRIGKRPRVKRVLGTSPKRSSSSPPLSPPSSPSLSPSLMLPTASQTGETSQLSSAVEVKNNTFKQKIEKSLLVKSKRSTRAKSKTQLDAVDKEDERENKTKRNRALVDSDSDCKSDTSEESDNGEDNERRQLPSSTVQVPLKSTTGTIVKSKIKKTNSGVQ